MIKERSIIATVELYLPKTDMSDEDIRTFIDEQFDQDEYIMVNSKFDIEITEVK